MPLMSGNEAIARGAWEGGASIGVAYPGTPSTETMESFAKQPDVYAEWAPNEKVAVEVGVGASAAGARVLSTMKHVGVNVAADPLFTVAYTGVNGGYVILAADDPGMYSSQNEQDSRFYALSAHIPMFEPADSQEAHDFTKDAYGLSERFDMPFMLRSTVRVSHTKCVVTVGDRIEYQPKPYVKDASKYVMMPAYAKPRRKSLDERLAAMGEYVETCPYNKIIEPLEASGSNYGVICSGAAYQHTREALPDARILKLGIVYPMPERLIRSFAESVDAVYVIDEASNYLSMSVKAMGIHLADFEAPLPKDGELTPGLIKRAFGIPEPEHLPVSQGLPPRPPALCPGCPHRLVFRELSRQRAIVTGDIGCYTLGALPPLAAMDSCVDMGASISMAHGFELGLSGQKHRPVVAVIGDSTFAHSGITSLLNTVYNQGAGTVCILDNRTTAMTGRQGNPVNGVTLQNRPSRELCLPDLVAALGVEDIQQVNPQCYDDVKAAFKHAFDYQGLSVIIFQSPCVLLERPVRPKFQVSPDCRACGVCVTIGCPAMSRDPETRKVSIDPLQCNGCGQCSQMCAFKLIEREGE